MEAINYHFMEIALKEAHLAASKNEVPIGAVIVKGEIIIAQAGNSIVEYQDPTAHAEMLVIKKACSFLNTRYLDSCDLYTSLEPCCMCAGAISLARIRNLYYAASDPKGGAIQHGPKFFSQKTCHHKPIIFTTNNQYHKESQQLLQKFFQKLRYQKKYS